MRRAKNLIYLQSVTCGATLTIRFRLRSNVEGVAPAELVKDAALRLLEDDARFRAGVRKGVEQAERGELIEEEEMDARVKRMFRP
jgi:hypothetical protein